MALLDHRQRALGPSALALFAATLAPLLYGLVLATPFGSLGSALPVLIGSMSEGPGSLAQPASLIGKLVTLVPLGPLALRVACASALATALCSRALCRSIDMLLRTLGVTHDALVAPVALGLCLFVFGMPSMLSAGFFASPFALQGALALLFLLELSRLEAAFPSHDLRPLGNAALLLGLAIANDAMSALLLLPAALPTLSRILHGKGVAPLLRALVMLLLAALGTHAVFSLRHELHPNAFAHVPALTRASLAAVLALVSRAGRELSWFAVLVGLGAVAALQTPGVRRIAMIWVYGCLVPLGAYGFLAPAPAREEGLGFINYKMHVSAVLAAALPGALLSPDGRGKPVVSPAQLAAVLCLLLIGTVRAHDAALQGEARRPDLLDMLSARGRDLLPVHGLVLVNMAENALPLMAASAEDRVRPDLHVLAVATFDHPSDADELVAEAPELKPLLRTYLLDGELVGAELESLSLHRPVLLDMDPSLPPVLYPALRPRHLFFEVSGSAGKRFEERALAMALLDDLSALRELTHETAAARLLGLHALSAALYFGASGDRASARSAVELGKPASPALPWPAE